MDQKFIDKIEDLRHNTYSRIVDVQKNICPMIRKLYMHYQFEYWYDGYKYNIWEDDTHLYAVNELPWCYDNELKNTVFIDTLDNLVAQDKVWPFLMFVDGVAIQWSKIQIIHDYDYTYLRINDITPDYSFYADIVVFPLGSKKIRYGEDRDVLVTADRKGFYFGTDGKRLESTDFVDISIRLEILDNDIYYKEVNLNNVENRILEFIDLPDGYIPTISNILIFDEDGSFNHHPNEVVNDIYNSTYGIFNLPIRSGETHPKWAILMYNTARVTTGKSYTQDRYEDLNKKAIIKLLTESPRDISSEIWQDIIDPLIQVFDFDHEFGTNYETNLDNAARYISQYDFRLWRDVFANSTNIKSFTFTGKDFKKYADDRGYIHLSRKHSDLIEDVVMMFVNSKLYEYSIDIYYTTNTINIPIFGIFDDDHIEIVMFTECNNNILDIVVPDPDTEVYIHPEYDLDNCYIMADYHPHTAYDVPEDLEGRRQYIVEADYTKLDNGNFKIELESADYYGKQLKIVPKKQFRYYRYKQKDNQYKIILPTQFNYCHDPNRYMIFVNGKKLDQFGDTKFVNEKPVTYTLSVNGIDIGIVDQISEKLTFDMSIAKEVYNGYKYEIIFNDVSYNALRESINGTIGVSEDEFEVDFSYGMKYILMISLYDDQERFIGMSFNTIVPYVPNSARTGEYAITIMNKDRPFSKLILYLSTILDPGDYIDIFYIPEVIVEKYKQLDMPKSGLILLDDEEGEEKNYPTTYPLSKYTSMVFVNGLKVNPLDIKDVSLNSLLINVDKYNRDEEDNPTTESRHYIDSVDNITIMEYVTGDEEIAQYIEHAGEYEDNWKKLIKTLLTKYSEAGVDYAGLQYLFGNIHEIDETAPNYKDSFATLKSILYDVILEYYLDKTNTGEPFVYDFRREVWKPEVDPDSKDVVKLITLFPDHDKLLDYEPLENDASTDDVQEGRQFLPNEG